MPDQTSQHVSTFRLFDASTTRLRLSADEKAHVEMCSECKEVFAVFARQYAHSHDAANHIPPHRAWTYLQGDGSRLTMQENEHLPTCMECLRLFLLCATSTSFGAVLKEVGLQAA